MPLNEFIRIKIPKAMLLSTMCAMMYLSSWKFIKHKAQVRSNIAIHKHWYSGSLIHMKINIAIIFLVDK